MIFVHIVAVSDEHDQPGGLRIGVNGHLLRFLKGRVDSRSVYILGVEVRINMVDQHISQILVIPAKVVYQFRLLAFVTLIPICNEVRLDMGTILIGDCKLIFFQIDFISFQIDYFVAGARNSRQKE